MSIRLSVSERSEAGASAKAVDHDLDGPAVTLGRDKACEIVLPRQAVSRSHARITLDGELSFIEDLGSSFGTQINGQALPKGEKRLLKTGDLIAIAQFDIAFTQLDAMPELAANENTSFVSRAMVRGALRGVLSSEDPFFRFMNGVREGDKVPIAEAQELLIGRDPQAEIRLTDDLVSRRHAKFRRDLAGVHVEDLESRNGVKVNKRKVRHRTLKDRDEVEVGAARLLFVDPNSVGEAPAVEVAALLPPKPAATAAKVDPRRAGAQPTTPRPTGRDAAPAGTASRVDPRREPGAPPAGTASRVDPRAPNAPPVGTASRVDPRREPATPPGAAATPEPVPPAAPEPPAAPAREPGSARDEAGDDAPHEPSQEEAAGAAATGHGDGHPDSPELGPTMEAPAGHEDDPAWITGPQQVPARGLARTPAGTRNLVMAGLGLVGLAAVILMIAILAGA